MRVDAVISLEPRAEVGVDRLDTRGLGRKGSGHRGDPEDGKQGQDEEAGLDEDAPMAVQTATSIRWPLI